MTDYARERRRLARILPLSLELLRAYRLRTLLSVSGLAVGVATVLVMVAVGKGVERRVGERVRAMGTDVLIVIPAPAPRVAGRERQVSTLTSLRIADADAIAQEAARAMAVAPTVRQALAARWEDRNTNVSVVGTTTDGLRILRIRAGSGREFDDGDDGERRRVALIGPTVVRTLFSGADPVGREIRFGAVPFEVIGVTAPRGTDIQGTDLDNEIVVPLQTAMRRLLNIPFVHTIHVRARSFEQLDALESEVREVLTRRHPRRAGEGGVQPFVIQNQAAVLRTQRGATRALNRLVVAVAALAMVVGGIGIVALMLLSVRERIREIGLRRAVGARRSDIRSQFVLESALLAAAGGAAGVVAGLLVSGAASLLGRWELVFPWWAALVGLVASAILGVSAGAIPAARAVALDPIAALRYDGRSIPNGSVSLARTRAAPREPSYRPGE